MWRAMRASDEGEWCEMRRRPWVEVGEDLCHMWERWR